MAFIPLKNVLLKTAERVGSRNRALLISLDQEWGKIAKDLNIPTTTKPQKLSRGTLTLSCESLAEAAALRGRKNEIKRAVNTVFRKEKIDTIRFNIYGGTQ